MTVSQATVQFASSFAAAAVRSQPYKGKIDITPDPEAKPIQLRQATKEDLWGLKVTEQVSEDRGITHTASGKVNFMGRDFNGVAAFEASAAVHVSSSTEDAPPAVHDANIRALLASFQSQYRSLTLRGPGGWAHASRYRAVLALGTMETSSPDGGLPEAAALKGRSGLDLKA